MESGPEGAVVRGALPVLPRMVELDLASGDLGPLGRTLSARSRGSPPDRGVRRVGVAPADAIGLSGAMDQFVFWGLFAAFGVIVVSYLVWMWWTER